MWEECKSCSPIWTFTAIQTAIRVQEREIDRSPVAITAESTCSPIVSWAPRSKRKFLEGSLEILIFSSLIRLAVSIVVGFVTHGTYSMLLTQFHRILGGKITSSWARKTSRRALSANSPLNIATSTESDLSPDLESLAESPCSPLNRRSKIQQPRIQSKQLQASG